MGCQFSAEKDVRPSPLPLETRKPVEGAVEHGTNTASNDFEKKSVLNPSVTLKQMLLRPNLTSLKEVVSGEAHHIKNVFAKPLDALHFQNFKAPVYPKTEEEKEFIMKALKKNFVFESLAHQELFSLMQSFETITASQNEIIIKEGDEGDYFYILSKGQCSYRTHGKDVGTAEPGDSFGELALLYTAPRAATVVSISEGKTTLYRVDQTTFRFILQAKTKEGEQSKLDLLKGVSFLDNAEPELLTKLAGVMTPRPFSKGDYVAHKGNARSSFVLIQEGKVLMTNSSAQKDKDTILGPTQYAGEGVIINGIPLVADYIAQSEGMAFTIDNKTFVECLGNMKDVIDQGVDKKRLMAIKVIEDSKLDNKSLNQLTNFLSDRKYKAGVSIMKEGKWVEAELFLMKSGKVHVKCSVGKRNDAVGTGGYFGDELLLADAIAQKNGPRDPSTALAPYTVTVTEDCSVRVLSLKNCRKVLDTIQLGKPSRNVTDSLVERGVPLEQLKRHAILGAGTFGQVWLVSRKASNGTQRPYGLKVQSKYELVKAGQARAIVYEKAIMSQLNHPFICRLVATYKDDNFVYMLMGLIQGGELYSVIHTSRRDGMKEKHAVFYAAGISEALSHMHRRGFIYRDLKPENVMIDSLGYPVVVDFGFAKYVEEKTFTLCGTPLYLAPEVILNRGHNWAADHWSLGILVFEIINGRTTFYEEGMDQMELFRAIVKCRYNIPSSNSDHAKRLIRGLLTKDPAKRLGSLVGGEDDILKEPWFEKVDMETYIKQEAKAPFVPKVKDPLDSSNFEDWSHLDDKSKKKFPKLKPEQEEIFAKF